MSVYPVSEDTLLVKRNLDESLEGKNFLEIGVGNGEISLKAAEIGADVTAVDINSEAVEYSRNCFSDRDLEAEIFESDLFEEVEACFDFIVFNPPYLSGPEGIGDEEMWRGGETGLETVEKFLSQASDYLSSEGRTWVVLSSRTDYNQVVEEFDLTLVDSMDLWFETLFLMELK